MNKLKEYRQQIDKTQAELAEIFNVSHDYISMIEREVQKPGLKLAKKMADYFKTTVDELFFDCSSNEMYDEEPSEPTEQNTA